MAETRKQTTARKPRKTSTRAVAKKTVTKKSKQPVARRARPAVKPAVAHSNLAQQAFWYLISFFALGFVVFGLVTLAFQLIGIYYPDPNELNYMFNVNINRESAKFALASLFVAAPLFYGTQCFINRKLATGTLATDSAVRRWLTYALMFIALAAILIDLVTLVYYFLDGEVTMRFVLKVATILLVAGSVLGYFATGVTRIVSWLWGIYFIAAIAAIVITSLLFLIEPPQQARERKADELTMDQLQEVTYSVERYFREEERLPVRIEQLLNEPAILGDAASESITYKIKGKYKYELCANFKRASEAVRGRGYYRDEWQHTAGKACFQRKIDKYLREEVAPVMMPVEADGGIGDGAPAVIDFNTIAVDE